MNVFNPNEPYNALPLLPPKADLETKAILKQLIGARSALAELKQAGELIPNQTVLINIIPMLEARDSSEIENIVTTTDNLFRFADAMEEKADPHTKETLRYREALFQGYKTMSERPLSVNTAVEICQKIKGTTLNIRSTPGAVLKNDETGEIVYTPPEGEELLRDKLSNLFDFIYKAEDIDPLVRMAVMHYQFEAIHPFGDGNGRTGRILNILWLIQTRLLVIPVLFLSRYIIQNRPDYYRLLSEVTTFHNWEEWIIYMLKAAEETAGWTTAKIKAIRALTEHTAEYIKSEAPGVYSQELVDMTFIQPYCRISDIMDLGLAKRVAASRYLQTLCKIGVLRELKFGREKLFIHPKYVDLLKDDENRFNLYGEN